MYTTFHLNSASELTADIVEAIKKAFKSKPIVITVEEEMDETAYLLSTPANRAHLMRSIEQAERGELIEFKIPEK